MASDRWKMPPQHDYGFYQPKKHDKWRAVEPPEPALEAPVADTHAHVHMLPDPLWELERATANGVELIGCVADPTEDDLEQVFALAGSYDETNSNQVMPEIAFTFGVHPHNAKDYSPEVEVRLREALSHPRARVLGEIGLDYHYDLSPRETQRDVFRQQIRIAKELGLPISLHLRGGENPETDNAHQEAFGILQEEGFPERGTLLHCCSLNAEQLKPWVEADCHIAYGGAFTFNNSEAARKAVHLVPHNRLLVETDAPYMTPVPMRGATCTPAHVVFTAAALAEELDTQPGPERQALLEDIWANSTAFFEQENPDSTTTKGMA